MTDYEQAEDVVQAITQYVNSYLPKENSFIAAMDTQHRTLQQSFTRLCIKWLEHVASIDYRYDERNRASHETAKKLIEGFYQINHYRMSPADFLPFI